MRAPATGARKHRITSGTDIVSDERVRAPASPRTHTTRAATNTVNRRKVVFIETAKAIPNSTPAVSNRRGPGVPEVRTATATNQSAAQKRSGLYSPNLK